MGYSQRVTKDDKGNYRTVILSKPTNDTASLTLTGKTCTNGKTGEVFPVYISNNGKEFIVRTSKRTGNKYKQYLQFE